MNEKVWKAIIIRALHTMAQTALGVIGTGAILQDVHWDYLLSAALLAGIISILKSVVIGIPEAEV